MTTLTPKPGNHTLLPGQNPDGAPVMAVLLKRTYQITAAGSCARADEDRPLLGGDKHYGDPLNSTVKFEADFVPWKLATDVVVNAIAYAPGGRPVREMTAAVAVGPAQKAVRILGDRTCHFRSGADPLFGDPAAFTTMELRYERAYGGVDVYTHAQCQYLYPRNHLGKGFAVANRKETVDGLELPNLEDPADALTPARLCIGKIENWPRQPVPAGFGWYSKYWHPRAGWMGILPGDQPLEQQLRAEYAKLLAPAHKALYEAHPLPVVDFRFFNGAAPGLSLPFLAGDEAVRLMNLTPDGELSFRLPGDQPALTLDLGEGVQAAPTVLHTVQIRAEERAMDLVWRAAFPYPGMDWLPQMKKADVVVNG